MPDDSVRPTDINDPASLARERYWRVVARTAREVFRGDPDAVSEVRGRLANQPPGTQEKFYQTDPYSVAADIAGEQGPGTPEQQFRYLRIKEQEEFGPVEVPDTLKSAREYGG